MTSSQAELLAALGLADSGLYAARTELQQLAELAPGRREIAEVSDGELTLPGRTLRTRGYADRSGALPTLAWFHGGGFLGGSLDAADPMCRELAARAPVRVVSVEYRLAPEHPYPDAVEDALAVVERLQPDLIGGDSAGGCLAAVVARQVPGLRAQVLLCPLLDLTLSSESVREEGEGHGLTAAGLRAAVQLYAGAADVTDPRVSPLLAADLTGLPPALVVTAEHDPLRDDGDRYAARLQEAGVHAKVRCWTGEEHGFPGMTAAVPAACDALQWVADGLAELLPVHG